MPQARYKMDKTSGRETFLGAAPVTGLSLSRPPLSMTRSPERYATILLKTIAVDSLPRHDLANDFCFYSQPQKSFLSVLDEYEFIIAPLIFTLLSFFTRMYRIGLSPIVTWDEAQ